MTASVLAPIFVTVTWIAVEAPWLISIIAITAATPMITPSMVSTVRIDIASQARPRDSRGPGSHPQLCRWRRQPIAPCGAAGAPVSRAGPSAT